MKTFIKYILQHFFGFENYLFVFSCFIIKKLRWDRNEKDFLYFMRLLPEEGIVLDIGANIGVMSYYLAKNHSGRNIYAFEPIPYNYKNLERIKRKYHLDNLNVLQIALGDRNGTIDMILPVEKSVRFHGLAHVKNDSVQDKGEIFQCPIKRLDDIESLRNNDLRITGIKIDVENYEFFVLKGASELLKKHKPTIYCELWDNENRTQTIKLLMDLGYSTLVLEKNDLVEYIPQKHTTQNFFFI